MMKKSTIFLIVLILPVILTGQELQMTFSATGAASQVDSLMAINLRTNQSVTMPGSETLILNYIAGVDDKYTPEKKCFIFPNPFNSQSTFTVTAEEAQTGVIRLYNLSGQMLAQAGVAIKAGKQSFGFTVSKPGVYLIALMAGRTSVSSKAVCVSTQETSNRITSNGIANTNSQVGLKDAKIYSLPYTTGDIIYYRCRGGVQTTIITDIPDASKNYTVNFSRCIDTAGRSYPTVVIGNQIWMAENLAYLPKVSTSDTGSETMKYYYVYGYEDTLVNPARNTLNYKKYGVLYNWPAAINSTGSSKNHKGITRGACPAGWHLPGDDEWKTLETFLGMTQEDADTINYRLSGSVGEKLKSTWDWTDPSKSNWSGFTSLATGYRSTDNGFRDSANVSLYWSATVTDTLAIFRGVENSNAGVMRFKTLKSHGMSVRCVKN
jgi:uncharacterized protein (TIGR02145 family)